jgi:hypothetical protein
MVKGAAAAAAQNGRDVMGPGSAQAGPAEAGDAGSAGGAGDAGDAGGPAEVSWQDREMIGALRRLALARSQLQTLTDAAAEAPPAPVFDTAALAELEQVHADLVAARDKARSRFGGGHARHRVADLEQRQTELLAHLGADTIEAARHEAAMPPTTDVVDPAVLAFAERELAAATRELAELRALDLPAPAAAASGAGSPGAGSPDEADDEGSGAEVVELRTRQQAS